MQRLVTRLEKWQFQLNILLANHDFTYTIMVSVFMFSIIWKKEIIHRDKNLCTWLSLDMLTKDKLNSTACFDAGFDDLTTQIIYLTETYSKYHSKSLHQHLDFLESFINPCFVWCVIIKCEKSIIHFEIIKTRWYNSCRYSKCSNYSEVHFDWSVCNSAVFMCPINQRTIEKWGIKEVGGDWPKKELAKINLWSSGSRSVFVILVQWTIRGGWGKNLLM